MCDSECVCECMCVNVCVTVSEYEIYMCVYVCICLCICVSLCDPRASQSVGTASLSHVAGNKSESEQFPSKNFGREGTDFRDK